MSYLLTPLHTHIDFGFGATGEAFLTAATKLESEGSLRPGIGNQHLPINYLRRHALELFLKSGIVIIHRKFKLPYGPFSNSDPHVLVKGKWKPFQNIHSVKSLWKYLARLFHENKAAFDSIGPKDLWTFPPETDTWIEEIERCDPRSTFFRYPTSRSPEKDTKKAVMVSANEDEITKRLEASSEGTKQFIVLMKDDNSNVTEGYCYEGEPLADFNRTLQECVKLFSNIHEAMRVELCNGG
ncbi:MAG: hypothetical protein NPIRA01_34640 [Nitrospirales bacterium]|nr:MAG: hypothetical protein NPIRA01_34640 [Nitrospirales bacterium]